MKKDAKKGPMGKAEAGGRRHGGCSIAVMLPASAKAVCIISFRNTGVGTRLAIPRWTSRAPPRSRTPPARRLQWSSRCGQSARCSWDRPELAVQCQSPDRESRTMNTSIREIHSINLIKDASRNAAYRLNHGAPAAEEFCNRFPTKAAMPTASTYFGSGPQCDSNDRGISAHSVARR